MLRRIRVRAGVLTLLAMMVSVTRVGVAATCASMDGLPPVAHHAATDARAGYGGAALATAHAGHTDRTGYGAHADHVHHADKTGNGGVAAVAHVAEHGSPTEHGHHSDGNGADCPFHPIGTAQGCSATASLPAKLPSRLAIPAEKPLAPTVYRVGRDLLVDTALFHPPRA